MLKLPEKILVVCLDNIGDLVFTSGIFCDLKKALPEAQIDVWCKHYTRAVAACLPHVGRVFAADPFWDKSPGHAKGSVWDFFSLVKLLRHEAYDLAFITSKQWRAAGAVRMVGARRRVGYGVDIKSRYFLTDFVVGHAKPGEPEVQRHGALLKAVGFPSSALHTVLQHRHIRTEQRKSFDQTIVLHPFAGSIKRCWPLDRWVLLAQVLRKTGKSILWIGQNHELDRLDKLLDKTQHGELWRGEQGMDSLVDLLENVAFYIGHDSGPLHVAHAFGAKVIGLYLPGEPQRTGPQGVSPFILLHRKAPQELSVEDVIAAANQLFK